jgi:uncharacterized protein DUF6455
MESAMPERDVHQPAYQTVEFVLDAIAGWINKYRNAMRAHDAFEQCSPEDVRQITKDLCISADDLRELAAKGPGAADLLQKMLVALHVDPDALAKTNPGVMRDLQRICITCNQKARCQHELAEGTASEHFHKFCPNAFTLDALFDQKEPSTRH